MYFNPDSKTIQLCAQGMEKEGRGQAEEAMTCFRKAWEAATDNFERFTAAHYVARHQETVADKLLWDEKALELALVTGDDSVKEAYPSLYLNIAKGYEDLGNYSKAKEHYELALSHTDNLPGEGYGQMIRQGIQRGLERINAR